jgi:hypothetical protein
VTEEERRAGEREKEREKEKKEEEKEEKGRKERWERDKGKRTKKWRKKSGRRHSSSAPRRRQSHTALLDVLGAGGFFCLFFVLLRLQLCIHIRLGPGTMGQSRPRVRDQPFKMIRRVSSFVFDDKSREDQV